MARSKPHSAPSPLGGRDGEGGVCLILRPLSSRHRFAMATSRTRGEVTGASCKRSAEGSTGSDIRPAQQHGRAVADFREPVHPANLHVCFASAEIAATPGAAAARQRSAHSERFAAVTGLGLWPCGALEFPQESINPRPARFPFLCRMQRPGPRENAREPHVAESRRLRLRPDTD